MKDEVFTIPLDFKTTKTSEMVTVNEDGSYTIFINTRLSRDAQYKAYLHAISHIRNGDFDKDNVQEIEAEAHDCINETGEDALCSIDAEDWGET